MLQPLGVARARAGDQRGPPESRKNAPIGRPERAGEDRSSPPGGTSPGGEVGAREAADLLVLVALATALLDLLGLGRATLDQPHGQEDVDREVKVLRLPVLRDADGVLCRRDVGAEA